MDIALDSESKGRGFESHCDHLLLLVSVCLYLVNYLLGCFNVVFLVDVFVLECICVIPYLLQTVNQLNRICVVSRLYFGVR